MSHLITLLTSHVATLHEAVLALIAALGIYITLWPIETKIMWKWIVAITFALLALVGIGLIFWTEQLEQIEKKESQQKLDNFGRELYNLAQKD